MSNLEKWKGTYVVGNNKNTKTRTVKVSAEFALDTPIIDIADSLQELVTLDESIDEEIIDSEEEEVTE